MKREEKLVKNTIILAFGTFFPKLAIFISLPVLTAYLTQAEYGTYDLVLTLVALVLPAATLQIHSAAFRYLIDVQHDEAEKTRIVTNIFAFILPTSLLALLIMYFILGSQTVGVRLAICAYFLCDIMVNACRQIIRGLGRNMDYAISSFVSALGQVLFTFVLVMGFNSGLLGALIALACAEFIATAHLMIVGRIYRYIDPRKLSGAELKELLSYSWPMVPNGLSQWVIHASDRLIISFFMGVAANAVFAVAYKIPSILAFAQTTFNMAWQENATIVSKDSDAPAYYTTMFKWLFDIVAGCMAILIAFTPLLFKLLVRGDYAEAYIHIPILYMGMFFYTLSTFWGGIFVAFKKTKSVGITTVVAAVLHLVLTVALIKPIGLYAASLSTLVSYFCLCAVRLRGVRHLVDITYDWKHICLVCAVLALQCVICCFQSLPFYLGNFVLGVIVGVALNWQLLKNILNKLSAFLKKCKTPKNIAQ